jgi:hypothetical protein
MRIANARATARRPPKNRPATLHWRSASGDQSAAACQILPQDNKVNGDPRKQHDKYLQGIPVGTAKHGDKPDLSKQGSKYSEDALKGRDCALDPEAHKGNGWRDQIGENPG